MCPLSIHTLSIEHCCWWCIPTVGGSGASYRRMILLSCNSLRSHWPSSSTPDIHSCSTSHQHDSRQCSAAVAGIKPAQVLHRILRKTDTGGGGGRWSLSFDDRSVVGCVPQGHCFTAGWMCTICRCNGMEIEPNLVHVNRVLDGRGEEWKCLRAFR